MYRHVGGISLINVEQSYTYIQLLLISLPINVVLQMEII